MIHPFRLEKRLSICLRFLLTALAACVLFSCGGEPSGRAGKGPPLPPEPRPVIIDTDTAISVPTGLDVDDDLAVLYALASPELRLLGLTITFGNAPTSRTWPDAVRLMEMAGLDRMPVLEGADWETRDLERVTDASRFLADTLRAADEKITVVMLGATTNLAAALAQAPEIEERIERIVFMGGYLRNGQEDLNFAAHPEAMEQLLGTRIPKVVVPAETCMQAAFTQREMDRVNRHPESVVYAFHTRLELFVLLWQVLGELLYGDFPDRASGGFFPWDVVAVATLTNPEFFHDEQCFEMHMNGTSLHSQPCGEVGDHRFRVTVPTRLNAEAFMEEMLRRIVSVPRVETSLENSVP
jgi:inosine-uridine nucleoside N-ribohydrolase